MTDLSPLQTRVEAGIAWLVLNRPQQRNALDIPTLEALHVRLDACERDPAVRAVVLGGSGRSFCAGPISPNGRRLKPVASWNAMAGPRPPTP
ncbi:enoyl-CoA hydratase/isomerase [Pseudomonas aeruginosa]|nr:enoyl-CoA hydratase/isomerase [Pseudomonas aeruginosa]